MTERAADADRVLACGRTVGALVELRAGDDSGDLAVHAAICPHCQAELADLDRTWAPVRRVANAPVEPPHGLVGRTLTTVRGMRREHGARPVEIHQQGGLVRISAEAIRVLTRALCAEVLAELPGVHLRGCSGGADEVQIELMVRYPLPAFELAEQVRVELNQRLDDALGAGVPPLWVRVIDTCP